ANIMVRRVEDKMAAGAKPSSSSTPTRNKKAEDTAEFKTSEIREQLRRDPREKPEPILVPGKTLRPVSDTLMAENAPRHEGTQTARRRTADTLPPAGAGAVRFPEIITFPQRGGPESASAAPRRESLFRFL